MRENRLICLLAVLVVGFVFVACNSAQGQSQSESRELVVGQYYSSVSITDSRLNVSIHFDGTGNTADSLGFLNKIPNAQVADAEATMLAFINEAQGLGCTVGTPEQSFANGGDVISFFVYFMCTEERDMLISTMGQLMATSLSLSLE